VAVLGPIAGPMSAVRRGPYPHVVSPPTGLGWTPAFNILELLPGIFTTDIATALLKPSTATIRYVDIATGNDGNTGLVAGSPKKSIWSAINVGGNDTIYVLGSSNPLTPTVYPYDNAWRLPSIQNTCVIAVSSFTTLAPGYVVSSIGNVAGDSLLGTWASTGGGTPNTYVATLAATPYDVVDGAGTPTAAGKAPSLTLRSSIATVDAAPGSWWWSAGSLYVRTADSRAPDVSIRALKSAINGWESVALTMYIERIKFEGGSARAFYLQNITSAYFVDCAFSDGTNQGLELSTAAAGVTHTVYLVRTKAYGNAGDGMGATCSGAGTILNWLEWDCEGTANTSSGGTDQGSSLHKTAGNGAFVGIRVGGLYHGNKTDGVADVGGMQTWMLGSKVYSEAIGIYIGGAGTGWVQGCVLTGNSTDLMTDNASGVINVSNSTYTTKSGTGTVQEYAP